MNKVLSPREALPRIRAILDAGGTCVVTVTGTSMVPLLRHGKDQVLLAPLTGPVRRGDVVFYVRPNGQCILHRVIRVLPQGDAVFLGDAQTAQERVSACQFVGIVTHIRRNGREFPVTCRKWRLVSGIWMFLRPIRPALLACIGWLAAHKPKHG